MLDVLSLSVIRLYLDNPRLSKSYSEEEALYKIVADQQKKLVKLAKDIANYRLSELDVIAVFPDTEKGFYRVAEGNRRIAALKLLKDPSLIENKYPAISQDFAKIAERDKIDFDHINVSIFPAEDDEALIHFLELRHLGEQGGVGTVTWNAKQKGRFDYKVYGKENLVIFLDELENKEILSREQIDGVTKTNWDRILRPIGLSFLRLVKENGTYKIEPGYEEEFVQKIRMVASELQGKTVGVVYDQERIEKFYNYMENQYSGKTKDSPDKENDQIANLEHTASESPIGEGNQDGKLINDQIQKPTERMPRDLFKDCKTVIPSPLRIQSRNHRITRIIQELKELPVEQYPNACGCLLRAMIELCAKEYLEHHKHASVKNGDATKIEFKDAIFMAKDHMVQRGRLTVQNGRLIKIETEKGGVRDLFNGYMHNADSYPSPIVILTIFQTYQEFLKECLR
ncbi:MAG: hypothetical protein ACOYIF_09230 [Acetivibrionales bacterium]|jgi:hypothetical protein